MKRNKGITLIALVITVIVLIILAGIGLYITIGILDKAQYSVFVDEMRKVEENINMKAMEEKIVQLGQPAKVPLTVKMPKSEFMKLPSSLQYEMAYQRDKKAGNAEGKLPIERDYKDYIWDEQEGSIVGLWYVDKELTVKQEKSYLYDENTEEVFRIEPLSIEKVQMHGIRFANTVMGDNQVKTQMQEANKAKYATVILEEVIEEEKVKIKVTAIEPVYGITKIELMGTEQVKEYALEKGEIIEYFEVNANKTYEVKVTSRDGEMIKKITITAFLPQAPEIEVIQGKSGKNNWYISDVQVKIKKNKEDARIVKTTYQLENGQEIEISDEEKTISFTEEKVNTITTYSYDDKGRQSEANVKEIKIDKTPPDEFTFTKENNIIEQTGTGFIISVNTTDNLSDTLTYYYYVGGKEKASSNSNTYTVTGLDPESNQETYVRVEDEAGNIRESNKIQVKVEKIMATTVKVGDYIDYHEGEGKSYTSSEKVNGYADQTFTTKNDLKWRVWSVSGAYIIVVSDSTVAPERTK